MTDQEWARIAAELVARWPHATIPEASIAVWFSDVADLEAEAVTTALRSYSRDGREFPPTGGMLRARVVELGRDDPDHGEAYSLVWAAVQKFGEDADAIAWLRERSPAVALAFQRYGTDAFRFEPTEDGTRRAQFRDIYRNLVAGRQRDAAYAGLPLERGSELRRLGAGDLALSLTARTDTGVDYSDPADDPG